MEDKHKMDESVDDTHLSNKIRIIISEFIMKFRVSNT